MKMNDNGPRKEDAAEPAAEEKAEETFDPRQYPDGKPEAEYTVEDRAEHGERKARYGLRDWSLAALSPFIYLLLGYLFGWWAWAWILIPIFGIIGTPMKFWIKCVALSPFLYVMLGFFFGWWEWAWILIPVSGILSTAVYKRK